MNLAEALATAINRLDDMLLDDDGQAFKEARKALPALRIALKLGTPVPAADHSATGPHTLAYKADSLQDIARVFYSRARALDNRIEADKNVGPSTKLSKREIALMRVEHHTWETAAGMLLKTQLAPQIPKEAAEVLTEYASEYAYAVDYAATQIWASLLRHEGDPRWEYEGERDEVLK